MNNTPPLAIHNSKEIVRWTGHLKECSIGSTVSSPRYIDSLGSTVCDVDFECVTLTTTQQASFPKVGEINSQLAKNAAFAINKIENIVSELLTHKARLAKELEGLSSNIPNVDELAKKHNTES